MAKKIKLAQLGANIDTYGRNQDLKWINNENVEFDYYKDKPVVSKLKKNEALKRFIINREDVENVTNLPFGHPLLNMDDVHRPSLMKEFEKDKSLSSLEAAYTNLHHVGIADGNNLSVLSRGYDKNYVDPIIIDNKEIEQTPDTVDKKSTTILKKSKPINKTEYYKDSSGKVKAKSVEIKDKRLLEAGYIPQSKNGKIIKDNKGQWNHPGMITKIDSNNITMRGVNYPVLGVSDTGDTKLMYPENNYNFKGNSVTEYPLIKAQVGLQIPSMNTPQNNNMFNLSSPQTNWGSENIIIPNQFSVQGQAQQFNNTLPQVEAPSPGGGGGLLGKVGGIGQTIGKIAGAIGQIKKKNEERRVSKMNYKLSKLINKASSLPVDEPERKYVRPEDQILDQDSINNSYGSGTNYLQGGGFLPNLKNQFIELGVDKAGNLGQIAGSAIGGGKGQASGEGQLGQIAGSTIGNAIVPGIGGVVGGALGGLIGGAIGGKKQKDIDRYNKKANNQLGAAAFQQGAKQIHNQYTGFMQDGGEIETHWGGEAEVASQNPYLPYSGESILFKGNSHNESDNNGNTGIGMTYNNTPVEVEDGEPAVKLGKGLAVFGDMKIPSYGITELGDPKAKGKKFKTYINSLNEQENKQNKIVDKATLNINDNNMSTSFDKLNYSSNEAMLKGANMKLKEIANKKQIAANVQNAILDTAKELNLDSGELAKGNIKKDKNSRKTAQDGDYIIPTSVNRKDKEALEKLEKLGFKLVEDNPNKLYRTTETKSKINLGSKEYQKWFNTQVKAGNEGKIVKSPKWGEQLIKLSNDKITSNTEYVDIYDVPELKERPLSPLTTISPIDPKKIPSPVSSAKLDNNKDQSKDKVKSQFDWVNGINSLIPYIRPSNQESLNPNQLSGEMFALASNNLEPVQAQLYNPLLEQVSDISLQDQLNTNQADFNAVQRAIGNNPAALSQLAAQKYAANSGVLGEQFRLNQTQRMNTYNKNRETLNDAQLKNLGILDQQYTRQSQAKSNTKAITKAALESISSKIAQNKLENRNLGLYENLYNYRFGTKGHAFNMNPLVNFPEMIEQAIGEGLIEVDENGEIVVVKDKVKRDKNDTKIGRETTTTTKSKKANGGIVKNYNLGRY